MDKILTFALPPIIGMPLSRLFSSWHPDTLRHRPMWRTSSPVFGRHLAF